MRFVISLLAVAAVLLATPSANALAAHPKADYNPAPRGAISARPPSATTAGASPTTASSTPTPAPQSQRDCDDPQSDAQDPYRYLFCSPGGPSPGGWQWDPPESTGDNDCEAPSEVKYDDSDWVWCSDPPGSQPTTGTSSGAGVSGPQIAARVTPAWEVLLEVAPRYKAVVHRSGARLVVGALPPSVGGRFSRNGNTVTLN